MHTKENLKEAGDSVHRKWVSGTGSVAVMESQKEGQAVTHK